MFCESCGHPITHPWPVEPWFTLDLACMILNISMNTLRSYLRRMKFESRYQRIRAEGQRIATRHRVLTASEVKAIRACQEGKGKAHKE